MKLSNFKIKCSDKELLAYSRILELIGYGPLLGSIAAEGGMLGYTYLASSYSDVLGITRSHGRDHRTPFHNISDFLVWHFTPEKSEAEKELDSLQQKMSELQAQMDKLKEAVEKGRQK